MLKRFVKSKMGLIYWIILFEICQSKDNVDLPYQLMKIFPEILKYTKAVAILCFSIFLIFYLKLENDRRRQFENRVLDSLRYQELDRGQDDNDFLSFDEIKKLTLIAERHYNKNERHPFFERLIYDPPRRFSVRYIRGIKVDGNKIHMDYIDDMGVEFIADTNNFVESRVSHINLFD